MGKRLFKSKVAFRKILRPSRIKLNGKIISVDRRKFSPVVIGKLIRERYETTELKIVKQILTAGDRVLEIGAGMGLVSMIAANIVGDENMLCYEADPEMTEIARRNFGLNKHDIEIRHGLIVSGKDQTNRTKKFNIHRDFWSSSSHREKGAEITIDVPVLAIEDLLETFVPNVLLIDIEGDEVELLMGMKDPGPVKKIIMETHYQWSGKNAINNMMRHLYSLGFDIDLQISGAGLVFLSRG